MKYSTEYTETITKKISKIKKKNNKLYTSAMKKIIEISDKPNKRYKFLKNKMKGFNRIHISSFVLIFRINHEEKAIYFEDFEHHDNVYQ